MSTPLRQSMRLHCLPVYFALTLFAGQLLDCPLHAVTGVLHYYGLSGTYEDLVAVVPEIIIEEGTEIPDGTYVVHSAGWNVFGGQEEDTSGQSGAVVVENGRIVSRQPGVGAFKRPNYVNRRAQDDPWWFLDYKVWLDSGGEGGVEVEPLGLTRVNFFADVHAGQIGPLRPDNFIQVTLPVALRPKKQCPCPPGKVETGLKSVHVSVNLGRGFATDKSGTIELHATKPGPLLTDPRQLIGPDWRYFQTLGGQFVGAESIAEIEVINDYKYKLKIYPRSQGTWDDTEFHYTFADPPMQQIVIENPDTNMAYNRLLVDDDHEARMFVWNEANSEWTLENGTGEVLESHQVIEGAEGKTVRHTKRGSDGGIISDVTETYADLDLAPLAANDPQNPIGIEIVRKTQVLISRVDDAAGAALAVSKQIHGATAPPGNQGRVSLEVGVGRPWKRYEYNALGDITRIVTQLGDNPPDSPTNQNREVEIIEGSFPLRAGTPIEGGGTPPTPGGTGGPGPSSMLENREDNRVALAATHGPLESDEDEVDAGEDDSSSEENRLALACSGGSGGGGGPVNLSGVLRIQRQSGVEVGRSYTLYSAEFDASSGLKVEATVEVRCTVPEADADAATNEITVRRHELKKPATVIIPYDWANTLTYIRGRIWEVNCTIGPDNTASIDYSDLALGGNGFDGVRGVFTGTYDATTKWVSAGLVRTTPLDRFGLWDEEITKDLVLNKKFECMTIDARDQFGRPSAWHFLDGTSESLGTGGCCGPTWKIDRTGSLAEFDYDEFGNQNVVTRDDVTVKQTYDGHGRLLKTTRRIAGGNPMQVSRNGYDIAGRLTDTYDALDRHTQITETFPEGVRTVTTTYPDGGTRVETFFGDGSPKAISGTAVPPKRFEYGVLPLNLPDQGAVNCRFVKEICIGENGAETEWTETYRDMLDRVVKVKQSGRGETKPEYNPVGQLVKVTDPDGVTVLYAYNAKGEREVEAIDIEEAPGIDRNGVIDYAGADRITKTVREFVVAGDGSTLNQRTTTTVWPEDGVNAGTVVLVDEQDAGGLNRTVTQAGLTTTMTTVLPGNGVTETTTVYPDSSKLIETRTNGRVTSSERRDSADVTMSSQTFAYADPFKRLTSVTDAGTGATGYTYYDDDQINTVATPDPDGVGGPGTAQVTTFFYDAAGRPARRNLPDGTDEFTDYWETGAVKKRYGSRTYPVDYSYDPQGRLRTLTTHQGEAGQPSENAATTEWIYKPDSGLLWKKTYADQKSTEYAWTLGGRLDSRTWARGITTDYGQNNAGETSSIAYDDGVTPSVSFLYDRQGRLRKVSDAGGEREVSYTVDGQMDDESYTAGQGGLLEGWKVDRGFDALLRKETMQVSRGGNPMTAEIGYGYDNASRLETVIQGALSATYSRTTNREVIGEVLFQNGANAVLTATQQFDKLNRFQGVSTATPTASVASTSYGFNDANQRTRADREDGTYWSYGYDELGQVTSGMHNLANGTAINGRQFGYTFDQIGNRKQTVTNGKTAVYGSNSVNQYTQRTVPGVVDVSGQAAADTTVTVNDQAVTRQGALFHKQITVHNGTTPLRAEAAVTVVKNLAGPNEEDAVMTRTSSQYVPKTPEVFTYDFDGNLTGDGQWTYTWDGENRLIAMERNASAVAVGMAKRKLTFAYDAQSRRIEKGVYDWDGNAGGGAGVYVLSAKTKFLYDGWNLLAEVNGTGAVVRSYVWGLDLSGTEQNAGGVGGLLFAHLGSTAAIPSYDGNGSVLALTDGSTGAVVARYEYGPFGEPLRATGAFAEENPLMFSTRYRDVETGLYNYGYRFYDAHLGRWLNRDPLSDYSFFGQLVRSRDDTAFRSLAQEALRMPYQMVGNAPTNALDVLGLSPFIREPKSNAYPTLMVAFVVTEQGTWKGWPEHVFGGLRTSANTCSTSEPWRIGGDCRVATPEFMRVYQCPCLDTSKIAEINQRIAIIQSMNQRLTTEGQDYARKHRVPVLNDVDTQTASDILNSWTGKSSKASPIVTPNANMSCAGVTIWMLNEPSVVLPTLNDFGRSNSKSAADPMLGPWLLEEYLKSTGKCELSLIKLYR